MKINLDQIMKKYSEPHRFYHNWDHVCRMMKTLLENKQYYEINYRLTNQEVKCINAAIIYHDIIYDVVPNTATSNEQRSALYFLLDQYGPSPSIDPEGVLIKNLILTTEYHFASFNPIEIEMKVAGEKDELPKLGRGERAVLLSQIMRDLDLISFTDKYEDFVVTNNNIGKEYQTQFTPEAVLDGRVKFLESILFNRSLHFFTLPHAEEKEATAYENIERYLNDLKGNTRDDVEN